VPATGSSWGHCCSVVGQSAIPLSFDFPETAPTVPQSLSRVIRRSTRGSTSTNCERLGVLPVLAAQHRRRYGH
jgi:hypothetical protein